MTAPYAPASRIATRALGIKGGSERLRANVSLLSHTGPTTEHGLTGATASIGETGTMPCQASYIAGRTRSFIAAFNTTNGCDGVCLTSTTEASSTPAGP